MSIRALFLDLDGTSLNDNNALSPALTKILTHLKAKGIEIIFSTGRSFAGSKLFAEAIGGTNYIINYNGARVFDFKNNRVLSETTLPKPVLEKVFTFADEFRHSPIFYHNNIIYTKDGRAHHYTCPGERFEVLTPHHDWVNETLTKALFIVPEEKMDERRLIATNYFNDASVYTSAHTYLEIMPKGINKSVGAQHVLERLNLGPENCVAFGDQLNDFELLKFVKHPFVMANATDHLLKHFPDRIVPKNIEDGVAKTLDEIFELGFFK